MAEIDKLIGATVARLRGGLSQSDLASRMLKDHGIKWSQTTVWEVEKGKRSLRFSEAIALAEVLEVPVEGLISYPDGLAELREGIELYRKRNAAVRAILENLKTFDNARFDLRKLASQLERVNGFEESEGLREQADRFRKLGNATLTAALEEINSSEKKRVERLADSEEHLIEKYITAKWEHHGLN